MRQMYDSVTAACLPADATLVGAYVDGHYANEAAVRARCPHATVVTITTRGTAGAHVVDCEPGDLTPVQAAAWAKREIAAGRLPTIYCNLSTWSTAKAEVAKLGITVSWWIAHYDGRPELIPGAVAKQYQERTDQNLDYGVAADYWPGVDPVVKPQDVVPPKPLPPTSSKELDMTIVYADGRPLCLLTGGVLHALKSNAVKDAYLAAGLSIHKVTPEQFDLIDDESKVIA